MSNNMGISISYQLDKRYKFKSKLSEMHVFSVKSDIVNIRLICWNSKSKICLTNGAVNILLHMYQTSQARREIVTVATKEGCLLRRLVDQFTGKWNFRYIFLNQNSSHWLNNKIYGDYFQSGHILGDVDGARRWLRLFLIVSTIW